VLTQQLVLVGSGFVDTHSWPLSACNAMVARGARQCK
jgi:hypothetical protein